MSKAENTISSLPDLFAEQSLDELEDEPNDEGQAHHVDVQVADGQRLLAVDEEIVRVLRLPHANVREPNVWTRGKVLLCLSDSATFCFCDCFANFLMPL